MDSGCSRHMTGNKSVLSDYHEEKGPSVTFGGNGKGQTRGFAYVEGLKSCLCWSTLTNGSTTFRRVAYVEGLKHNLLSISQFCDKDHKVSFTKKDCKVKDKNKNVILTRARLFDVYAINMNTSTENVCFMSKASSDINWLWHKPLIWTSRRWIIYLYISLSPAYLTTALQKNLFARIVRKESKLELASNVSKSLQWTLLYNFSIWISLDL